MSARTMSDIIFAAVRLTKVFSHTIVPKRPSRSGQQSSLKIRLSAKRQDTPWPDEFAPADAACAILTSVSASAIRGGRRGAVPGTPWRMPGYHPRRG